MGLSVSSHYKFSPLDSRLLIFFSYLTYLVYGVYMEEQRLIEDFGQAYVEYKKKVPYRFIPFVY